MKILPAKDLLINYAINAEPKLKYIRIGDLENLYQYSDNTEKLLEMIHNHLDSYWFLSRWQATAITPLLSMVQSYINYANNVQTDSLENCVDYHLIRCLVINDVFSFLNTLNQHRDKINPAKQKHIKTIASFYLSKSEMNKLNLLE